jgi:CRP-like cAMP-binding protein
MSTTTRPTLEQLRQIDLMADLDDSALRSFADAATMHEGAPGERISEYGQPGRLILLLEGELEMLMPDGEIESPSGTQIAPTWIGAIPTLLDSPNAITLRAQTNVRYAVIEAEAFIELTLANRPVFNRAMAQMKPVLASIGRRQQQRERMESLGTMAAGLAHELNNPAAAARRTASELADALGVLSRAIGSSSPAPSMIRPCGWWRCRARHSTAVPPERPCPRWTPPTVRMS